ncbi:MAG: phosphatase PAP2 family protein [Methanococcaceae archaeon]
MTYIIYVIFTFLILSNYLVAATLPQSDFLKAKDSTLVKDTTGYLLSRTSAEPANELSWHHMITGLPHDYSVLFKNTFGPDFLKNSAGLVMITGALMMVDQPAWTIAHDFDKQSKMSAKFGEYLVHVGDGKYQIIIAGLFSLYGFSFNDTRSLKTAGNLIEVLLAAGLTVQAIKRMTGRESPSAATRDAGAWNFFPNFWKYQKNQSKYYAFPSGHITTATAAVTVLANNYPELTWIRPAGYSLVALLASGLMAKGMHWASDFPLGIAIGYAFGNIIAPPVKEIENRSPLTLTPQLFGNNFGLSMRYQF